jgi:hypothetical protein
VRWLSVVGRLSAVVDSIGFGTPELQYARPYQGDGGYYDAVMDSSSPARPDVGFREGKYGHFDFSLSE